MKIGEIYKNKVNGDMVEIWHIEQDLIMYEPLNQKENENVHLILECTNKKTFKKMFVLDKKQSKKIEKKNEKEQEQKQEQKEQPTFTITKRLKDCSIAHRLMNYDGKCSNLHGHTYHFEVTFEVKNRQHNGISIDFNDFKFIDEWLQTNWDHATLLNEKDINLIHLLESEGQNVFTMDVNPTVENMCIILKKYIKMRLIGDSINNDNLCFISDIKVKIWETETSICEY